MVHAQQVKESRLKRKIRDARKTRSYERGTSKGRVSNHRYQRGKGGSSPSEKPTCTKCGKKHVGECLVGTDNYFGCGKSGHKVRDCPMDKAQGKKNNQSQASGPSSDAPKKNCLYSLCSRGDQEDSPNVVTGILQIFSIIVYALLDPGATLSFVTPLVAMKFDVLPDILIEPFSVITPVGDSVVAKRVFRSFPLLLSNRVTLVILGIDWLHACFASIDC
ncbi:uncharacterized protein LOC107022337 [Solanum pennellii]|uniref:Uncharacterized protein LOC107022337 n=1 Tax=Solanum pennellii TaxID=28526 RepID=A0ABM1H030_SOLPN|nr:uncharacterized protein LOC107022337 [Solanum pennellii]